MQNLTRAAQQGAVGGVLDQRVLQQGAVGGVLDQRVLEQIFGHRRHAALEDQARFDEAAQRLLQFGLGEWRGCCQQLIGKVAPDGGAIGATVLAAMPNRSRRPSSEACKVAGTASDDDGTAAIDA